MKTMSRSGFQRLNPSPPPQPSPAVADAEAGCGWQASVRRRVIGDVAGRVGVDGGPARPSASQRSRTREGGSNAVVESQPSKLLVAGSIPLSRSSLRSLREL